MTFWKRLRTYLVGVSLGLLLVYVFFKDRDLSGWTPQGRVLIAIDSSDVTFSERAKCQFRCNNFKLENWREVHNLAAVNFSESNTQQKPCPVYQLNSEFDGNRYQLIWEVCENDEKVKLLSFRKEGKKCDCG